MIQLLEKLMAIFPMIEKIFQFKIERLPIEKEIFEEKQELREVKNDIKEVKAEIKLAKKKRKYTKKVKKGKIIISEEIEPLQEFNSQK